jgi:diguanylate cyclase (GGDEF)-like protein
MICEYFNHGSVFRIGGDEFVVILQDKGYETLQDVLDEFNRKVEENLTEDKVVVSVGHSELTERDTKLKDVFERADQEMYARKQELKAMGAKTRS